MPESDRGHAGDPPAVSGGRPSRPRGRRMRRFTASLVVLVELAAIAAHAFDLGPRWFDLDYPSPVEEPAAVPPPAGLTLPDAEVPGLVAGATEPSSADPTAVRRAVARLLRDERLGPRVAVAVSDLATGELVYRSGAKRIVPASTLKMLTSAAALESLGGDHRFRTTVVQGDARRRIVLVGGGDPLLARRPVSVDEAYPARADLVTLARATAKALLDLGRSSVRLGYDDGLFEGPAFNPAWPGTYLPDVVTPITALWVDEGRDPGGYLRSPDPALAAAQAFAAALERRGITVRGAPREKPVGPGAQEIAAVEGAPLAQVVQRVLEVSDNEGAEVLLRQAALATGREGSFGGGAEAVHAVLQELGIDTRRDRILDGSGLSRENLVRPETLLAVIQAAASPEHPELRPLLTGLPVAGFTGSLADRFATGDPAGPGDVRAKTGTLRGVRALAGTALTRDGVDVGFVVVADRVREANSEEARARVEEAAAALAACACGLTP